MNKDTFLTFFTFGNKTGCITNNIQVKRRDFEDRTGCLGRKHPNGILPHQFVSIYEAFEGLELEGLTWAAFLQGLSILSVQKEIGVYEEVHFYERLRQSRQRKTPSIILRNGVADVMRMMCFRGQIKMDNEPKTTESPLFVLEPIAHENEIFA